MDNVILTAEDQLNAMLAEMDLHNAEDAISMALPEPVDFPDFFDFEYED